MIVKARIGNTKATLSVSKVEDVAGVNSMLGDKSHILMWDFDYTEKDAVIASLWWVQETFGLPRISVLKTSEEKGFHAYCFKRCSFQKACEILSTTEHIDINYFRMGAFRGYWTLRVSEKSGRSFELCDVLESKISEDVGLKDLKHFTMYDTTPDGSNTRIVRLDIEELKRLWWGRKNSHRCTECGKAFKDEFRTRINRRDITHPQCPFCRSMLELEVSDAT